MATYRIEGKGDGNDYGVYEGETAEQALQALFDDAGATGAPKLEDWIVTEANTARADLRAAPELDLK
jgi:hypothetical protein